MQEPISNYNQPSLSLTCSQDAWAQPYIMAVLVPVAAQALTMFQDYQSGQWMPEAAPQGFQPCQQVLPQLQHSEMQQNQGFTMEHQSLAVQEPQFAGHGSDLVTMDEERHMSLSAARRRRRQRASERICERAEQPKAPGAVVRTPCPTAVAVASTTEKAAAFSPEEVASLQRDSIQAGNFFALKGSVWALSRDAQGCRLVQVALEKADPSTAKALALELMGHAREAAASPHANFVLQKVVTQLSPSTSRFVAEELLGTGARFARHRTGCRIFCRLLEFCGSEESTQRLVDEVLQVPVEALELCRHSYGHHVVKCLLEHGNARHKKMVADVLTPELYINANHRSASYVVEAALKHCSLEDQQSLMAMLTPAVNELAQTRFGCYVVATLLTRPEVNQEAWEQAFPAVKALTASDWAGARE